MYGVMRRPADIVPAAFGYWGQPDECERMAEGIYQVSTPSHGGWVLSAERQARIPRDIIAAVGYGADAGAWEEDCAWSVPCALFWDDIAAACGDGERLATMRQCMRTMIICAYPKFAGRLIKPQDKATAETVVGQAINRAIESGAPRFEEVPAEAVRRLAAYTGDRCDVWMMAGPARAQGRARVMSALVGQLVPQSRSGVNAIRAEFLRRFGIEGGTIHAQDERLRAALMAALDVAAA